ncbi:MAG TPA: hypothetical protein VM490_15165, partial [Armatimonadaceae bacterium]|nr:hypothetical protein [Armatimonadaceae bacterium]
MDLGVALPDAAEEGGQPVPGQGAPSGTAGNTYGPVDAVLRSALSGYGLSALLCGVWEGDSEVHSSAMGDSLPGVPATREMHMRVGGVTLTCLC